MKICPVCNEAFVDEMNFCDVDGSPLGRDPVSAARIKSRLWSMLGVVLLVGALGLSVTVIFLPRPRLASPQTPPSVEATPEKESAQSESASNTAPQAASGRSDNTSSAAAPVDVRPARTVDGTNPASPTATPNPKAAALDTYSSPAPPSPDSTVSEKPATLRTDTPKTPKSAATADDGEPRIADTKREQQSRNSDPKTNEKDAKKKANDKEKKGGFFRVFKKIFGKD